jgi:hypothetical protein
MYLKKNGTPDHSPMKVSPHVKKQHIQPPLDFSRFNGNATSVMVNERRNRPRDLQDILGILDPRMSYQKNRPTSPDVNEVLSDR